MVSVHGRLNTQQLPDLRMYLTICAVDEKGGYSGLGSGVEGVPRSVNDITEQSGEPASSTTCPPGVPRIDFRDRRPRHRLFTPL